MDQKLIDKAIYNKYIEPTKKERKRVAGIEIEMPIVNLNKNGVEKEVVYKMADAFKEKFGFEAVSVDDEGHINSMIDKQTGDDLSFDCSYNNLELSMGKGKNLFEVRERFDTYYIFINEFLSEFNYTLTGMGINPYYYLNDANPVPNERYRMLYHYLHSDKKHKGKPNRILLHKYPEFATFCSASQVQIDVNYDELIDVINTFGKLEPYKALLFANSYFPECPDLLCSRNMLWEHSMQGYNPHNLGMFEHTLESVEELVEYIKTQSMYCTMRDGKYIDFTPIPVNEFFYKESVTGEFFNGKEYEEITFKPELSDLEYLRTFKFVDLTFRGTIEFRSSCCQPISDSMTIAAFHIGLLDNWEKLKTLLDNDNVIYSHGYSASELPKIFSGRELPGFVDKDKLKEQLITILDIAREGLFDRGYGEEELLEPLYKRAKDLTNPAKELVDGLEKGKSIEDYILAYSLLEKAELKVK